MAGEGDFNRLGPYVLLRTSGAGGMGRIELALRAQPGSIAKLCVLKRMHAELRSPEQEARFRREANIALQLSHGAIAQTVGVEEIDGELVLLQELVHGVDLRLLGTRLASAAERVPLAVAIHIVSEVARALAYAHAFGDLGIVHRDVTPDNVMLAFSGEVKLIDFGIARSDVDATLTSTGHIVGRPTYTAPEIWDGAQADRRADIYSLGVVLWQLLTGQRMEDVRTASAATAPAPSTHNPEVSPQLDAVVARALASNPTERHQTAGELQEALRPFVPTSFLPEPALAELLARHFDVSRERRMLAAEVAQAMRHLDAGVFSPEQPAPEKPADVAVAPPPPTANARTERGRRVLVAGIVAAVLAVAGATAVSFRGSTPAVVAAVPAATPAKTTVPVAPSPIAQPVRPPVVAEVTPEKSAKSPLHAHPIAVSAGRARPPGPKAARPAQVPSVPVDELLKRAQEKFDVGETGSALALARQAAAAGARAPAHVLMGKVLMSEHRFDEAEREFAEAVRLDPGDAKAARLLALVRETRGAQP